MTTLPAAADAAFLRPAPRPAARPAMPDIVWEVPPADFEIPDEPMDNTDQFLLAAALKEALACAGLLSETELYGASLALCAKINGQTVTKAPDWFYVPVVHPTGENRGSYTPIAEGTRPAVVMEFLSDNRGREYDTSQVPPYGKWFFYEKVIQAPFYVIFNSKNGEIEVYQLSNGRYKPRACAENGCYWIDAMQLFLGVWSGLNEDEHRHMHWLRWWDTDGNLLPWRYEKERRAEEKAEKEREKAERAREKAEREREKAERERERAERAEREKQAALAHVEHAEHLTIQRMARQMLLAQVDIAVIAQVTGLDEAEISALQTS